MMNIKNESYQAKISSSAKRLIMPSMAWVRAIFLERKHERIAKIQQLEEQLKANEREAFQAATRMYLRHQPEACYQPQSYIQALEDMTGEHHG